MSFHPRRPRVALVVVAALFAVSCSSATVQETAAVKDELPDPPNVSAGTLKLTDFPEGWTVEEDEDADDEPSRCAPEVDTTSVDSKTFTKDPAQVSNTIDVYGSVAEAVADMGLARDPAFLACFKEELTGAIVSGIDDPSVKVTGAALEPIATPKWGDDTVALRLTVAVAGPGGAITLVYDFVIVRVGRVTSAYFFFDADQPFDEVLRDTLIDVSSKRLPVLP